MMLHKVKEFGIFVCLGLAPFVLFGLLCFWEGSPGNISSLHVFGPGKEFVCIWTDGQNQALFERGKFKRLISIEQSVEVGARYCVFQASSPGKFIPGRVSLKKI